MKKRGDTHIIDDIGTDLLRSCLPIEWVTRQYKPDYGVDCAVEVFDYYNDDLVSMGEHFYVQLKSTKNIKKITKKVHPRFNVEKSPLKINKSASKNIDVITFQLERSELELALSMGTAAPLLLMVADINNSEIYWVCLNDFVDKVLLPENPDFFKQESYTIYIPNFNKVSRNSRDLLPIKFYAKRAKLYSAFNRFRYQKNEIEIALNNLEYFNYENINNSEFLRLADHFINIASTYDFWDKTHAWPAIEIAHIQIKNTKKLINDIQAGRDLNEIFSNYPMQNLENSFTEYMAALHIKNTFDNLANLGNIFEEICREWFLPTFLGQLAEEHSL